MARFSRKIAIAMLATSIVVTTFAGANIVKADKTNGATAGVSATFSYNLMMGVAQVEKNDLVKVTSSEEERKKEKTKNYYGTDSEGNQTICGYTNLGIAKVDGNLNVRKEASKSSAIVGKMTNETGCEVLEEKDDWVRIQSGNVKGWVSKEYLLTEEDALEAVEDAVIHMAKVKTASLRVRASASTNAKVITTVAKGERLEVVKELDGWVKIEIDNEKGYISSDYVQLSYELKEASTLKELSTGGNSGVSSTRLSLVHYALQFVGGRYVWGGTSLTSGVDCSGFTMRIYQKFGISLPHYSGAQASRGTRVSASEAKPGDLFFYGSGSRISHVAIYIGNGQIVHASSPRTGIKISNAFYRNPIKVVRLLND